ncbi:uncharacterized protein LOC115211126 [Argonauta hians]
MFTHLEWKTVLPLILCWAKGLASDVCIIQDDQGSTHKVYCKFGCCESVNGLYCCVKDYVLEAQYEYGYKIAGGVVGVIIGSVFLVVVFRCLIALHRLRNVTVITVDQGTGHNRSVSTVSRQRGTFDNNELQPPSTISYPRSSFISVTDETEQNFNICTRDKDSLIK